jgi:hypothetical protein
LGVIHWKKKKNQKQHAQVSPSTNHGFFWKNKKNSIVFFERDKKTKLLFKKGLVKIKVCQVGNYYPNFKL